MTTRRRFSCCAAIALTAGLLAASAAATAQAVAGSDAPAVAALAPDLSKFRSPKDGWLDLSGFLDQAYGFVPLVIPITEPAVGYGAVGGLMFIDKPEGEAVAGFGRPNLSFVGALGTENGTRGILAGDVRHWRNDRLKSLVGGIDASINLDLYGLGRVADLRANPLRYNIDVVGGLAQGQFRIGSTPNWIGVGYLLASTTIAFDAAPDVPGLREFQAESRLGALTASLSHDSRNNVFTPTEGSYLDVSVGLFSEALGGSVDFQRVALTGIHYLPLDPKLSLGIRGGANLSYGDVPFYLRPFITLRGVPVMRYQGDQAAEVEAELRWQFWQRFSLVAFAGTGAAWSEVERQNDTHPGDRRRSGISLRAGGEVRAAHGVGPGLRPRRPGRLRGVRQCVAAALRAGANGGGPRRMRRARPGRRIGGVAWSSLDRRRPRVARCGGDSNQRAKGKFMERGAATRGKVAQAVAGAERIEIKATIPNHQIGPALRRLGLTASNDEERFIYFFDTPELDLLGAGIIARARRVVGDEHDSTVKFRPVEPADVGHKWRKYRDFKIEADASETGTVKSASFSMPVAKGLIKRVAGGKRPIAKLFTEEQEAFLTEMAGRSLDFSKLAVLGPLLAQRWEISEPACPWPITAELWRRGDGKRLLEVSIKAPTVQAAAALAGFMAYLAELGAERDLNQQTKTRWALDYYVAKLARAPARKTPTGKTPSAGTPSRKSPVAKGSKPPARKAAAAKPVARKAAATKAARGTKAGPARRRAR